MDNIDIDYTIDKFSSLLKNDPRLIRSPEQLAAIRQQRQQQAQQGTMASKRSGAEALRWAGEDSLLRASTIGR